MHTHNPCFVPISYFYHQKGNAMQMHPSKAMASRVPSHNASQPSPICIPHVISWRSVSKNSKANTSHLIYRIQVSSQVGRRNYCISTSIFAGLLLPLPPFPPPPLPLPIPKPAIPSLRLANLPSPLLACLDLPSLAVLPPTVSAE